MLTKKKAQEKTYLLDQLPVAVCYRQAKGAKGIRIKIASGDRVVVTGNTRTSFQSLDAFFALHKTWAEKKLRYFRKFPNPTIQLSPKAYAEKKEKTRKLVMERLQFWNEQYRHQWKRVTIRNQSTRWGSCSSAGTLSFHAGLIDLPAELQDYLIVHELCHLRAMNHSERFWGLVQRALPEAKALDTRLKKFTPLEVKHLAGEGENTKTRNNYTDTKRTGDRSLLTG